MSDTRFDRAPGDSPALAGTEGNALSDVGIHTIGLILAVVLTGISFWVANTSLLWAPGVLLGLAVLAIAQMGVHLVFFLHITRGPDSTNNVLALALGILIVILVAAGSIWIMANLNENMMPSPELMNLHMQH
jgi:cytochrome o ubiquinol oxidase operon protein cyoD